MTLIRYFVNVLGHLRQLSLSSVYHCQDKFITVTMEKFTTVFLYIRSRSTCGCLLTHGYMLLESIWTRTESFYSRESGHPWIRSTCVYLTVNSFPLRMFDCKLTYSTCECLIANLLIPVANDVSINLIIPLANVQLQTYSTKLPDYEFSQLDPPSF